MGGVKRDVGKGERIRRRGNNRGKERKEKGKRDTI